jgi:hypothetical protein
MVAQSHSILIGKPWSPDRPFANWPTSEQWTTLVFEEQDRSDRRQVFEAMKEAGLVGTFAAPEPVQRSSSAATGVPESGSCTPPPAGRSRSAASMSPSRARLLGRLTAFRHCTAGNESCGCRACVAYWQTKPEIAR